MRRHVYFYTLISSAYPSSAEVLRHRPEVWLPPPAERAGEVWHVTLHAEGALPRSLATHLAEVQLRGLTGQDAAVGITWRSARSDRLLPVLEGELTLAELDGEGAHLSLLGSYRPPLSVVGDISDRILGQHVAEACVRRFVLDVATRLEAATSPQVGTGVDGSR